MSFRVYVRLRTRGSACGTYTRERTHVDSVMRLRCQDSTKYSLSSSRPSTVHSILADQSVWSVPPDASSIKHTSEVSLFLSRGRVRLLEREFASRVELRFPDELKTSISFSTIDKTGV